MKVTVIGDSTSGAKLYQCPGITIGWAEYINDYLDSMECTGYNRCMVGWGIRDFFNRKAQWLERTILELNKGDVLLACFGTLERSPLSRKDFGARGSLPGKGSNSEIVYDEHYQVEYTVYTFGEYLRKIAEKAKNKGINLYFLSQVPRNTWEKGRHKRTYSIEYARIMEDVSIEMEVGFLDINEILAIHLQEIGETKAKDYYSPTDKSHTTPEGARVYAQIILSELEKKYPNIFKKVA